MGGADCRHRGKRKRWGIRNAGCCPGEGGAFQVLECRHPEVADFENGECCLNGEAWNLRNCQACELREPLPEIATGDYTPRLTWAVVLRMAPRQERYVERTIASLAAAGWTEGTILAEPGVTPPRIPGWKTIQHRETLGSFRNFLAAIRHGLKQEPDAILSVEDDVVFCQKLIRWVEHILWPTPDTGVLSLYTASHQTGAADWGQYLRRQRGPAWGTLAQVFRPDFARRMVNRGLAENWHSERNEDQFVVHSAQQLDQLYLSCVPSVAQHVGDQPAIQRNHAAKATGKRQAGDFVGESYNAAERIAPLTVCEWTQPIETPEEHKGDVERLVTFGITHFNRPDALRQCVASIRRYYPRARIVVADNGSERINLVGVKRLDLEFDAGISVARNAISDQCETPFWMILEEDFEFIDFTTVGALLNVLNHRPDIAVAAGSLLQNGTVLNYDRDMRLRDGDFLVGTYAAADNEQTPDGVTFRPCDMVLNFGVIRTDVARALRWDDRLKVGEHFEFFWRLKQAGWRAAHVPGVVARHARVRPKGYAEFRSRAADMHEIVYRKHNLAGHRIEHEDERLYSLPAGMTRRGPLVELPDGL